MLIAAAPVVADAHSKSSTAAIPGGGSLTADIWMQNFASANGCGDFRSAARVNVNPSWIKDAVTFHASGISASLSGVGVSLNGADASASVVNDQGQRDAYVSGNICGNITTVYISGTTTAQTMANGNLVTASASI